jgi:hypothetical protein
VDRRFGLRQGYRDRDRGVGGHEQGGAVGLLDVALEVPDQVATVVLELHLLRVGHQRGLDQVQQRGEALVVTRVGRCREEHEGIARAGDPLGQPVAFGDVVARGVVGEVVDLVADDDVEPDVLHFAERPLAAFEVVERGNDPRLDRPGIGPEVDRFLDRVDPLAVEDLEVQAELGGHLLAPLFGDAGRADDQDAGSAATCDQLAEGDPGLDRLAQADVTGVEDPRPGKREHPEGRDLLIKLEPDAGPSGGHQCVRRRGQGEQEGFVQQAEAGVAPDALQPQRRQFIGLHRLQREEHRPLAVPQRPVGCPDPQAEGGRVIAGDGVGVEHDAALAAAADRHPGRECHVRLRSRTGSMHRGTKTHTSVQRARSRRPEDHLNAALRLKTRISPRTSGAAPASAAFSWPRKRLRDRHDPGCKPVRS